MKRRIFARNQIEELLILKWKDLPVCNASPNPFEWSVSEITQPEGTKSDLRWIQS
jgi:hypothetical protein